MKNKETRQFSTKSAVHLGIFLLISSCAIQSGLAQQWHSPHSIPIFCGTDAQDRACQAMLSQNQCISHLSQLGIALRVYASDHLDHFPETWQACEDVIEKPALLTCPASPYQFSDTNWATFDFSKASYTLFTNVTDANPESLSIVCNFHGNYALGGGSSHPSKPYAFFPIAGKGSFHFPDHALVVAHKRADVITCLNNLSQIEIACRVYSSDNGNYPPNFAAMQEALGSPRVLYCPASEVSNFPTNFSQVDYSQVSYTMAPISGAVEDETPHVTCRYHGNFSRTNGRVERGPDAYNYPGIIVGNPISQTVDPGATACLKVLVAYPPETVSFQWRRQQPFDSLGEAFTNTVVIPGATNQTLYLTNCTAADEGYYDVVVSLPSGLKETSFMTYLAIQPVSNIPLQGHLADLCCRNNLRLISVVARIATESQQFPTNKAIYAPCLQQFSF